MHTVYVSGDDIREPCDMERGGEDMKDEKVEKEDKQSNKQTDTQTNKTRQA